LVIFYCGGNTYDRFQNTLQASSLPPATKIFLSGRDNLIPSNAIKRYLESHGIPIHWFPDLDHAQLILYNSIENQVIDGISVTARTGESCYKDKQMLHELDLITDDNTTQ